MRAITQCARIARQVRFASHFKNNNRNTRVRSLPFLYLLYMLLLCISQNVRASSVICALIALLRKADYSNE